ncbi:hypothetical protein Y1Q_0021853 [Alligator mississippiensis]|uniref:Uncharacterized protein n=1 Tax=Alligator mississippiensis TaxID=8496 RepID=A0A151PB61_ALLMI|nr:hypothetical protein Y1Q_0021853 [Alligator mississippiensis]
MWNWKPDNFKKENTINFRFFLLTIVAADIKHVVNVQFPSQDCPAYCNPEISAIGLKEKGEFEEKIGSPWAKQHSDNFIT